MQLKHIHRLLSKHIKLTEGIVLDILTGHFKVLRQVCLKVSNSIRFRRTGEKYLISTGEKFDEGYKYPTGKRKFKILHKIFQGSHILSTKTECLEEAK